MRKTMQYMCISLFLFIFCGSSFGETIQDLRARGVPVVTLSELRSAFDDNPVAVIVRYKYTGIMISGIVDTIDIRSFADIDVSAVMAYQEGIDNTFILFVFSKYLEPSPLRTTYLNTVANLKKNDIITVHGYPFKIINDNNYKYICLKDCSIIDDAPQQK